MKNDQKKFTADPPALIVNMNILLGFLIFANYALREALINTGFSGNEEEFFLKSELLFWVYILILPFSAWILFNRRNWFGFIAITPTIIAVFSLWASILAAAGWPTHIDPSSAIYDGILIVFLVTAPASVVYFIKRFDNKLIYLVSALLISTIVILDLSFIVLTIAQATLFLLAISLPFYLLYKGLKDNIEVFRSLRESKKLFAALTKTIVLWSPFIPVIIGGLVLGGFVNDLALSANEEAWSMTDVTADNLLASEDCSWWNFACKQKESIKQELRVKFEESRSRSFEIRNLIPGMLSYIALISNVITFFLAIKSFFYVFARVGVSKKYGLHATLAKEYSKLPSKFTSAINRVGHEYHIPAENEEKYFVVRTLEASGCPPKFAVPQWKNSSISRILTKSFAMNEISRADNDCGAHLSATGSAEFIEWNLKDGEEIIFRYQNLAALTESVALKTIVSFRLPSLVFGKVFHSCARGPGKIIFLSKGGTKVLDATTSIPINRAIAWNRDTQFEIKAQLNPIDVFFSGVYFKPSSPDAVILDSDERGTPETGLVRFIKNFVIPF